MFGTQDLLVGLVIAAFFFGAKRLPELAGSLGKSMKEFKKAVESGGNDIEATPDVHEVTSPAPVRPICASCQAPLATEWRHCPRCGAAVPFPTAAHAPPAP
jgi:sec-independent protein translocase protein TatA